MSKSLEELKNEFINQASNNIDKCPECGFHSLSKLEDAWDVAIKAVSDRERKLVEALERINNEELNSQRPGGGYSKSAKISYEALKDYRGMK